MDCCKQLKERLAVGMIKQNTAGLAASLNLCCGSAGQNESSSIFRRKNYFRYSGLSHQSFTTPVAAFLIPGREASHPDGSHILDNLDEAAA
jgi:hypothetical protein